MASRAVWCGSILLVLAGLYEAAFAQGDAAVSRGAKIDKNAVEAAVKKACDWLKSQQKPDGSWTGAGAYDLHYPYGSTAFVLYALLKGTENGESECVKKGFDWLRKRDFPSVYSVSALILALCALWEPSAEEEEKQPGEVKQGEKLRTILFDPFEKRARKKREDAPAWQNEWLKRAVNWLLAQQAAEVWRYPGVNSHDDHSGVAYGGAQDASNTQYALLALHAASGVGINAPADVYAKVAEYFIREQDKDGPDVKPFPVPAADLSIKKLKELEKAILSKLREESERAVKEGREPIGAKDLGPRTTLEMGDPYKEFGAELSPMKARGWSYLPRGQRLSRSPWQTETTGSMTTSGVGALIICKANLEGTNWYLEWDKNLRQAIRDGMAWIAHNFTLERNPGPLGCWKCYYLYGIERAGVLSLTRKIGDHFWYEEGARHILSAQQGDGSWPGETFQPEGIGPVDYGPIWPTCFCILFLKRATTPVVNLPEPTYTGEGLLPGAGK